MSTSPSWVRRIHAATKDLPYEDRYRAELMIAHSALVVAECDGVDIDDLLDRIHDDVPRLDSEAQ